MHGMGFDPDHMKKLRTEHFVFHYPEGGRAERDIREISERQEKCFREICDTLEVEPDFPTQYFFLNPSSS